MEILENELLSKHSTFHLGGKARYFCFVKNISDLKKVLEFANKKNIPFFILGGGSNVIANDGGYEGAIIRIMNQELRIMKNIIEASAGVSLAAVIKKSLENNLVGLEWAYGIPGTIGGAVRGNAGAYGGEMKDSIESVKVFRNGKTIELKNKDCKFRYRESIFKKNNDIILSVKFKLKKVNSSKLIEIKKVIEKIKKERKTQILKNYSAGSFFKNVIMNNKEIKNFQNSFPETPDQYIKNKIIPAGWLIDQCDLKGFCIGDICVSEKHAGILINKGNGKSDELFQLVSLIKTRVRDKFGLELQEEIEYIF